MYLNYSVENRQGKTGRRISNEMLKYGGQTLQLYILKLFNGILKVEKVPQNWGSGLIIPIPKTGDKN